MLMGILTTISLRSHHHLLLPFPSTIFLLSVPGLQTPSGKTSTPSVIKSMSKASVSPAVLVCLAYFQHILFLILLISRLFSEGLTNSIDVILVIRQPYGQWNKAAQCRRHVSRKARRYFEERERTCCCQSWSNALEGSLVSGPYFVLRWSP